MEDIIIKSSLGAVGVLSMFLIGRLWVRLDSVEKENKEIVGNYKDRFETVLARIAAMELKMITMLGAIETKLAVDAEKHETINARIEALEKPKRRKAS